MAYKWKYALIIVMSKTGTIMLWSSPKLPIMTRTMLSCMLHKQTHSSSMKIDYQKICSKQSKMRYRLAVCSYVSLSERGDRAQRVNVETHFCCLYDVMTLQAWDKDHIKEFGTLPSCHENVGWSVVTFRALTSHDHNDSRCGLTSKLSCLLSVQDKEGNTLKCFLSNRFH